LARQARIQGEVRVRFTTDGESVISADAETGHDLLRKAAEQNVRTWKFAPHEPGTFIVTFRYKFQGDQLDTVFLPPSAIVELSASLPIVQIDWSWLDQGSWKAQLKSARGNSQQVLRILTSGPEGRWLEGDMTSGQGQKEGIDYGHFDEDRNMFAFTVMLSQPKAKRLHTFFIGKINGDKMTGTFVDDEGMTGQWTAVREKEVPGNTDQAPQ
jgi:hypothetical protein